jgi:hypothetical protein
MRSRHAPSAPALLNQRGAALFAAVLAMLLLSTMTVAFTILARDEAMIGQNARESVQSEFGAEAGASHGRWTLAQRVRQDVVRVVATLPRATVVNRLQNTYNTPAGAAQMLLDLATPAVAGPAFVLCSTDPQGCPEPSFSPIGEIPDSQQVVLTINGTNPVYTARVTVGVPPAAPPIITSGGTSGVFNYMWRVDSVGTAGRATQAVSHDSVIAALPSGTFTVALQSSFVQYAHFIDQMDQNQAWISFRHVYTGPVHTNTRFNILGNPTGPTFRSEATQTLNDIRFNNNGGAITQARDSTAFDWPLLGPAPGVLCQQVDCTGLTRNYDYDPSTGVSDPIPFPAGPNPADRQVQATVAMGPTPFAGCTPAANPPACPVNPPVIVASTPAMAVAGGQLNGGIFMQGSATDVQLDGTGNGQVIHIYYTVGGVPRRTRIEENRLLNQTTVARECWSTSAVACNNNAGSTWRIDTAQVQQTLNGVFTPNQTTDFGVLYVNGTIGVANTETGLRQMPGRAAAVYQDLADPTRGSRWTVVANGNIFITGHLAGRVDPRGPDLVFSSPTPGTGDDQLGVQNVLGVVSWGGGIRLSRWLSQANLGLNYAMLPTDLILQGMFMAVDMNNGASPIGEISFDDPNGAYRGIANLLGGVVQKTMGTFGSPGTPGTGYARNWLYDERFRYRGLAPPAFPGFPRFTAATSLGIDSYTWRLGRF